MSRLNALLFSTALTFIVPVTVLAQTPPTEMSAEATKATEAKRFGRWGFDPAGMDTTVKPGDDFFNYANGTALKAMTIPGDQPGYGSFNLLADLSEARLKGMIETLAPRTDLKGDEAKIAGFYNSMMDVDRKNALDDKPLAKHLKRINAVKTKTQMAAVMGQSSASFGGSFFGLYVYDDAKKPGFYALQMGQAGLGLPDRDYYLDAAYADKLAAYQVYIADMLALAGHPDPTRAAADVVAMETEIARVSWTAIENRDDTKTYNPFALKDLPAYAPGFDWAAFFKGAGVTKAQKIVVWQNTAMPKIAKIFADTPLETLKAWQTFHTTEQAAGYLSERFYTPRFNFRSKTLYGVQEQRPLWKRAIGVTDDRLGEALGKAYVERYFPESSKAMMEALVADLLGAMKIRIEGLTWMSEPTKVKALEKLSTFKVKIGYPEKWRDYSALKVRADDLFGNVDRSMAFEWAHQVKKIDQPADALEWELTPQTVNAYYMPTRNEIVFPAAILQPPFFDPEADAAVNYGAIGGVIGHEIVHGFDDSGRNYDSKGALSEWWAPEDAARFKIEADKLGAQFDTYQVGGVNVQGGLTMGENIADLGGLLLGLDAYRLSLKGQAAPVLDGFSGDQRVFLGWAQVWQGKYHDDYMKSIIASDPHAPNQFRVIGPMRNIDDWYKIFGITPGDKAYLKPEDRVKIW